MNSAFQIVPENLKKSLFNKSQFRANLTLSRDPVTAYKKCLKESKSILDNRFQEGTDVEILVQARAWLIDQVLTLAWEHLNWNHNCKTALLAVGGYGRGEMHPGSDIDILILLQENRYNDYKVSIEAFLTLLWDIGLKVGSSVRSLEECAIQAEQDLSIITNLMESRVIAGNASLHTDLEELIDVSKMWPRKAYLQAKFDEQRIRHKKYGDSEYNLEPNIKGSPGGLRDLHMLGWVARRHYNTHDPAELLDLKFLTETEHHQLKRCRAFLWKVRWALHSLTDRCEDRLLFDHQRALATHFGYKDHTGSMAVEQFMQSYYRTVMMVTHLKDLLLQHFDDDILNADASEVIKPLNDRFQIYNNYLETTNDQVFTNHPPAILELFVLLTKHKEALGPRAKTIRLVRDHRHLIDSEFRKDPRCCRLFLELMQAPYALTSTLRRMARYGILGRYLPEFGRIIGQMQFDLFHTHTVDAHTFLLIKQLRGFRYSKSKDRYPIASNIIHKIPKPELLYIAGLYHDIGKGLGGDHSQLGAEAAESFCRRHGLNKEDTSLISWLVREHLTMSITAQKQDLSDPQVIQELARKAGSRERLDYLYTLTVADINATNPNLWNGWRASLLQQLHSQAKHLLKRGIDNLPDIEEQLAETKSQAMLSLEQDNVDKDRVSALWQQLSDDYFLRHEPMEISWHTSGIISHQGSQPLILIRETRNGLEHGGSKVFIYTQDEENLFAASVAALDQLCLSIQDARISTSADNYSLDSFTVLEDNGSAIGENGHRIRQIQQHLGQVLNSPDNFPELIKRRTPRQLRHFSDEPEIHISSHTNTSQTVIEITATDRPGLLALIGNTFSSMELQVQGARIATFGEKVEDRFYVTNYNGEAISDVKTCRSIRDQLKRVLFNASERDAIAP